MKAKYSFYSYLLFLLFNLNSLAHYKSEKIHLLLEQDNLSPGDTIIAHGFLVNTETLSTSYSKYVYIELINSEDSVLIRKKLPCSSSTFSLYLPTPDYLKPNTYYLRAYSRLMRNESINTYPLLPVKITFSKEIYSFEKYIEKPQFVKFYPEGGNLVAGCLQRVAFKVTDHQGLPSKCVAELRDEKDSILLSSISVEKDGIGILRFTPSKDKAYHLRLHKHDQIYPLPSAGLSPSIQISTNRDKIFYTLISTEETEESFPFSLYFRGAPCLNDTLTTGRRTGALDISSFPAGIFAGVLSEANKEPIAERLFFHNRDTVFFKEYQGNQVVEYRLGENISPMKLFPGDTTQTYFYRIQRAEYEAGILFPENTITSSLWITSELSLSGEEQLLFTQSGFDRQAIDRLLICKKWQRFELKKNHQSPIDYTYKPEQVLTLTGKVETEFGWKQKEGHLVAINTDIGATYEGEIRQDGSFEMGVDNFLEGNTFFVQAYDKKRNIGKYAVLPDNDSYPPVTNRLKHFYSIINQPLPSTGIVTVTDSLISYYKKDDESHGSLPEIQIAARIKTKDTVETDDFYSQHKITEEIIKKTPYPDIRPYLDRLIGIRIVKIPLDEGSSSEGEEPSLFRYAVCTTRGVSTFKKSASPYDLQPGELPILLDGFPADTHHALTSLDPRSITSIERLTPAQALAYTRNALNGALVIRTRTYKEEKRTPQGVSYQPFGLFSLELEQVPCKYLKAPKTTGSYWIIREGLNGQGVPHCEVRKVNIR